MIPQHLYSPAAAERLRQYLMDEIRTARAARKQKEDLWVVCHEAYRAIAADPKPNGKTFPFHGASNLVVPIIATDVETVFSRMMGLLFEPESLFSMSASMPEMSYVAPRVEEFMKWSQHNEIDWQSPIGDWILEICKLGTGVLKQRYNREVKKVYEWRELQTGTWQQQALILLKDAPSVHRVPVFDYYVPPGFRHLNEMPWCAEQFFLTWRRLQNRIAAGVYQPNAQMSAAWATSSGSQVESRLAEISGFKQSVGNKIPLTEFWVDWDIDESGLEVALVCTIHEESGQYIRLDYNPFFNQDKPYSVARFMRDENSFWGIGLGEMSLDHQDEITAMHNQRIDSGTITNSGMYAVSKSNTDVAADEPIFPGKVWRLNKPDDIQPIQLGQAGVSASIEMENATLMTHQRRVGINDWSFGQPSTTSAYGTAFNTQQIQINSTRRQGEFLRELRNALSESGTRVLELYQQFNQRGKEFFALGAQDGAVVRQVLQFPQDLIRRGLKVNVTAVDVSTSKDAKMRSNMILMQQLMQYYQGVLQAVQMAGNPQLPQELRVTALDMIRGTSMLMHDFLDSAGQQEAAKMLPQIAGVVDGQQQQLLALQQLIQSGGGRQAPFGAAGNGQQPGMGAPQGLAFPVPGGGPGQPQIGPGAGGYGPSPRAA